MLHTLLLNSTYECIAFVPENKVWKLLSKDKVEVLESWDVPKINFGKNNKITHPSVIRLKNHVRWIPRKIRFNRTAVFRRDQHVCQYCSKALTPSKLTMDHVIPRGRGGENSWRNCVTSCFECNNKKGMRTPEEARMVLLRKPATPQLTIRSELVLLKNKHDSWKNYIPQL